MKWNLVKKSIHFSIKADPLYFVFLIFISVIDGLSFGFVTKSTLTFFTYLENSVSIHLDKEFFIILSVFIFSIAFNFFINGFINYLIDIDAKKITTFVNYLLHEKLNNPSLPLNFFNKTKNIEMINAARDGAFITGYVSMILIMFLTSTIPAIASMSYYLFQFNFFLGFSFLIIAIPNFIIFKYQLSNYVNETEHFAKEKHRKKYAKEMMISKEFFKETRILNAGEFLFKKYLKYSENLENLNMEVKNKNLNIEKKIKMLNFSFYFIIFIYSLFLTITKKIDLADFGTVFTTTGTLIFIIENLFENDFSVIRDSADEVNALNYILDYKIIEKNKYQLHTMPEIIVENMSFSYPDAEHFVLENINLTIPKGKTLAIVGDNGSGKTTLSKLLLGLLEPTKGTITIDGKNTNENKCLSGISALSQHFILYNETLEENIQLGNIEKERNIDEVIKWSSINKSFQSMDKKTELGKEFGGTDLSKGQAQSLAIVRSLYPQSFYISLDEPTSALDPETENKIISSMKEITKNKTAIVITHRLAMTKHADIIICLKDGKIIEQGSFEELIKKKGHFEKIFTEQAKWYI